MSETCGDRRGGAGGAPAIPLSGVVEGDAS